VLTFYREPGRRPREGASRICVGTISVCVAIARPTRYHAAVDRGLSYESEGANRNAPVNFATVAERDAAAGVAGTTNYSNASAALPGGTANLLAGGGNHASADAPFGIQGGYIFNAGRPLRIGAHAAGSMLMDRSAVGVERSSAVVHEHAAGGFDDLFDGVRHVRGHLPPVLTDGVIDVQQRDPIAIKARWIDGDDRVTACSVAQFSIRARP